VDTFAKGRSQFDSGGFGIINAKFMSFPELPWDLPYTKEEERLT